MSKNIWDLSAIGGHICVAARNHDLSEGSLDLWMMTETWLVNKCKYFDSCQGQWRGLRVGVIDSWPATHWTPKRHYDVIQWKHFRHYWPSVRGIPRSPVNSPHKGQWRGGLMFSLICAWMHDWVNNREAGDLRRNRAHYDVTVMRCECTDRCPGLVFRVLICNAKLSNICCNHSKDIFLISRGSASA